MSLISEIFPTLLPGRILDIHVGYSRTAVLAETAGSLSCGLAATLANPEFDHRCHPSVKKAGHLLEMSLHDLVFLAESDSHTEVSIGLAAINALVPMDQSSWVEMKAEDYLLQHSVQKNVAMVGHFHFIEQLQSVARNLWVLELNPRPGDFPADQAPEFIPQADVVAITATTLVNHTLEGLLELCRPDAKVVVLGPSTPLTPVLFDRGVDVLCGTVVIDPQAVMSGISQGGSTHQFHHDGIIKMVTMQKRQG